jgi:ribonuclease HIII
VPTNRFFWKLTTLDEKLKIQTILGLSEKVDKKVRHIIEKNGT